MTRTTPDTILHGRRAKKSVEHYSPVELFDMAYFTMMAAAQMPVWSFWSRMQGEL